MHNESAICGGRSNTIAMTMMVSIVVLNHLREAGIMNSPILEHIANENTLDIMRSVELFIGIVVVVSVIGFICLAAV